VKTRSVKAFIEGFQGQDRRCLAEAITLAESAKLEDRARIQELLLRLTRLKRHPLGAMETFRMGVTGPPGVGKSTWIEALGTLLLKDKRRLCVLTIDPSSPQSGGSILGDKTRMPELSSQKSCFIRPSPSRGYGGGVAEGTRTTIALCEAFGFDTVLVETVGVGQSEVDLASMVDFFVLLLLPYSGDELQGIKRGVAELADLVFINKSDLDESAVASLKTQWESTLSLFRPRSQNWSPKVESGSALRGAGLDRVLTHIEDYKKTMKASGDFDQNRSKQVIQGFRSALDQAILQDFFQSPGVSEKLQGLEKLLKTQDETIPNAVYKMLQKRD
jgi:LAO/AO transport system kinase